MIVLSNNYPPDVLMVFWGHLSPRGGHGGHLEFFGSEKQDCCQPSYNLCDKKLYEIKKSTLMIMDLIC